MLADMERVKSYLGKNVIIAAAPSSENPGKVTIIVGKLMGYDFLTDVPFGKATVLGAARFTVNLGMDEYQQSDNSWNFPTQRMLEIWASHVPSSLEFLDQSIPAAVLSQEVRDVIGVSPLEPGMKESYFQEADELLFYNRQQEDD